MHVIIAKAQRAIPAPAAQIRQPQLIAPIHHIAVAAIQIISRGGRKTIRLVGVAPAVIAHAHPQPRGPDIEQLGLAADLPRPAALLGRIIRVIGEKTIQAEIALLKPQRALNAGIGQRVPAQPHGACHAAIAIGLLPVRLQPLRSNIIARGGEALPHRQIIKIPHRASHAAIGAKCILVAPGHTAKDLRLLIRRRTAGDDIDHTANRAAAIKRAGRPAQHLNPLHPRQHQRAEIKGVIRVRRIIGGNAIDQHLHMARIGAAKKAAGQRPRPTLRHHPHARHGRQRISQRPIAEILNISAGDNAGGGRHALHGHRNAGAGDDCIGDGLLRPNRRGQRSQNKQKKSHQLNSEQGFPRRPDDRRGSARRTRKRNARRLPRTCFVASVHPARYARDNSAKAGLLARGVGIAPLAPPSQCRWHQWHQGRDLRLQLRGQPRHRGFPHPRVPVSTLPGHRRMGQPYHSRGTAPAGGYST